MAALASWLARYDLARFTIRQGGLPRFAGMCLLSGYVWLAAGGVLSMLAERWPASIELGYDARLHSIFLGFVFSMIFAHAPIVLPAVTGLRVPYSRAFYVPLALLDLSLLGRVAGDCLGSPEAYRWGGLANVVAVLLFLATTAYSLAQGRRSVRRRTFGAESCVPALK